MENFNWNNSVYKLHSENESIKIYINKSEDKCIIVS